MGRDGKEKDMDEKSMKQDYEAVGRMVKEILKDATDEEKKALDQVAAGIRIGYQLGRKQEEKESA